MSYYIGIDPSTAKTGYAVIDKKGELVSKGVFSMLADDPFSFQALYTSLVDLLETYKPESIMCEQQFGGPNVMTTIKLIRPTGVILAVAGLHEGVPFEFKMPKSWRKTYHTGTEFEKMYSKRDSFKVTKERYPGSVTTFNKDNDISDAIGIAYACWKLSQEEG